MSQEEGDALFLFANPLKELTDEGEVYHEVLDFKKEQELIHLSLSSTEVSSTYRMLNGSTKYDFLNALAPDPDKIRIQPKVLHLACHAERKTNEFGEEETYLLLENTHTPYADRMGTRDLYNEMISLFGALALPMGSLPIPPTQSTSCTHSINENSTAVDDLVNLIPNPSTNTQNDDTTTITSHATVANGMIGGYRWKSNVELVVLNCCQGDGIAEWLTTVLNIPYVVASPEKVPDQKSTQFFQSFYRTLYRHKTIKYSLVTANRVSNNLSFKLYSQYDHNRCISFALPDHFNKHSLSSPTSQHSLSPLSPSSQNSHTTPTTICLPPYDVERFFDFDIKTHAFIGSSQRISQYLLQTLALRDGQSPATKIAILNEPLVGNLSNTNRNEWGKRTAAKVILHYSTQRPRYGIGSVQSVMIVPIAPTIPLHQSPDVVDSIYEQLDSAIVRGCYQTQLIADSDLNDEFTQNAQIHRTKTAILVSCLFSPDVSKELHLRQIGAVLEYFSNIHPDWSSRLIVIITIPFSSIENPLINEFTHIVPLSLTLAEKIRFFLSRSEDTIRTRPEDRDYLLREYQNKSTLSPLSPIYDNHHNVNHNNNNDNNNNTIQNTNYPPNHRGPSIIDGNPDKIRKIPPLTHNYPNTFTNNNNNSNNNHYVHQIPPFIDENNTSLINTSVSITNPYDIEYDECVDARAIVSYRFTYLDLFNRPETANFGVLKDLISQYLVKSLSQLVADFKKTTSMASSYSMVGSLSGKLSYSTAPRPSTASTAFDPKARMQRLNLRTAQPYYLPQIHNNMFMLPNAPYGASLAPSGSGLSSVSFGVGVTTPSSGYSMLNPLPNHLHSGRYSNLSFPIDPNAVTNANQPNGIAIPQDIPFNPSLNTTQSSDMFRLTPGSRAESLLSLQQQQQFYQQQQLQQQQHQQHQQQQFYHQQQFQQQQQGQQHQQQHQQQMITGQFTPQQNTHIPQQFTTPQQPPNHLPFTPQQHSYIPQFSTPQQPIQHLPGSLQQLQQQHQQQNALQQPIFQKTPSLQPQLSVQALAQSSSHKVPTNTQPQSLTQHSSQQQQSDDPTVSLQFQPLASQPASSPQTVTESIPQSLIPQPRMEALTIHTSNSSSSSAMGHNPLVMQGLFRATTPQFHGHSLTQQNLQQATFQPSSQQQHQQQQQRAQTPQARHEPLPASCSFSFLSPQYNSAHSSSMTSIAPLQQSTSQPQFTSQSLSSTSLQHHGQSTQVAANIPTNTAPVLQQSISQPQLVSQNSTSQLHPQHSHSHLQLSISQPQLSASPGSLSHRQFMTSPHHQPLNLNLVTTSAPPLSLSHEHNAFNPQQGGSQQQQHQAAMHLSPGQTSAQALQHQQLLQLQSFQAQNPLVTSQSGSLTPRGSRRSITIPPPLVLTQPSPQPVVTQFTILNQLSAMQLHNQHHLTQHPHISQQQQQQHPQQQTSAQPQAIAVTSTHSAHSTPPQTAQHILHFSPSKTNHSNPNSIKANQMSMSSRRSVTTPPAPPRHLEITIPGHIPVNASHPSTPTPNSGLPSILSYRSSNSNNHNNNNNNTNAANSINSNHSTTISNPSGVPATNPISPTNANYHTSGDVTPSYGNRSAFVSPPTPTSLYSTPTMPVRTFASPPVHTNGFTGHPINTGTGLTLNSQHQHVLLSPQNSQQQQHQQQQQQQHVHEVLPLPTMFRNASQHSIHLSGNGNGNVLRESANQIVIHNKNLLKDNNINHHNNNNNHRHSFNNTDDLIIHDSNGDTFDPNEHVTTVPLDGVIPLNVALGSPMKGLSGQPSRQLQLSQLPAYLNVQRNPSSTLHVQSTLPSNLITPTLFPHQLRPLNQQNQQQQELYNNNIYQTTLAQSATDILIDGFSDIKRPFTAQTFALFASQVAFDMTEVSLNTQEMESFVDYLAPLFRYTSTSPYSQQNSSNSNQTAVQSRLILNKETGQFVMKPEAAQIMSTLGRCINLTAEFYQKHIQRSTRTTANLKPFEPGHSYSLQRYRIEGCCRFYSYHTIKRHLLKATKENPELLNRAAGLCFLYDLSITAKTMKSFRAKIGESTNKAFPFVLIRHVIGKDEYGLDNGKFVNTFCVLHSDGSCYAEMTTGWVKFDNGIEQFMSSVAKDYIMVPYEEEAEDDLRVTL